MSTPIPAADATGSCERTDWRDVVVLVATLVLFAVAHVYVVRFATPMPFFDDLSQARVVDDGFRLDSGYLFEQVNQHRVPLPRLVHTLLVRATRDFRTPALFDLWLLGAVAFGLAGVVRRLRGRASASDVFFPLALSSWAQHENFLNGFQIVFVLPVVLACAVIATFASLAARPAPRQVARVAILAALSCACGAVGLTIAAGVAAWLAWTWSALRRVRAPEAASARRIALAGVVVLGALAIAYFAGLELANPMRTSDPARALRVAADFLAQWTGSLARAAPPAAEIVAAVAFSAGLLALARLARRRPNERPRWLGLAAIAGSVGLLALSIGFGRGAFGGAGAASRYTTLSLVWPAVLYVAAAGLPASRAARGVEAALCAVALVAWFASVRSATRIGEERVVAAAAVERSIARGLSYSEIAALHAPTLFGDVGVLRDALAQLDRAGVAPFARVSGPDRCLLVGRDPCTGEMRGPGSVSAGSAPVVASHLGRDALAVQPGTEISWSVPARVVTARGRFAVAPETWRAAPHASMTFVIEVRGADGAVLASLRRDVEAPPGASEPSWLDFAVDVSGGGRTLVLRFEAGQGADAARARAYWTDVRLR